jgi:hypothetical protein
MRVFFFQVRNLVKFLFKERLLCTFNQTIRY